MLMFCEWNLIVVTIRTERVIMTFFTGMMFNDSFNNISIISWRQFCLVEKTGVPCKNHQSATAH
jgi:hypothetical protein